MAHSRRYAALVVAMASLVACGNPAADEVGLRAGTGLLDETAFAAASPGGPQGRSVVDAAPQGGSGPAEAAASPGALPAAGQATGTTPTTVARKSTTTTTSKASTGSSAPDLEQLMLTAGPPGYEREDDDDAVTGRIDFDDAVEYDDEDDSEEFFRRHGFEGGWDRAWMRGEYDEDDEDAVLIEVYDTLYRFRDAGGASAYMDRMADYIESSDGEEGIEVIPFAVSGIPGAKGYAASHPEWGSWATVLFTKDRYSVHIDSSEETVDKAKEVASSMARAQYDRL